MADDDAVAGADGRWRGWGVGGRHFVVLRPDTPLASGSRHHAIIQAVAGEISKREEHKGQEQQ